MKKSLKLKQLNTKGLSHHILIAVLVISGIAGFGAWRVYSSSAATATSVCGSGYSIRKSKNIYRNGGTSGEIISTLSLLSNGNTYCSVLMSKNSASGVSKPMSAKLGFLKSCSASSASGFYADRGFYPYTSISASGSYGSHVYVKKYIAGGQCVLADSYMKFAGKEYYAHIYMPN